MTQHFLLTLGFPGHVADHIQTLGISSVEEFALHFFDAAAQQRLADQTGVELDLIASAVRHGLRQLSEDSLQRFRQQAQERHPSGVVVDAPRGDES